MRRIRNLIFLGMLATSSLATTGVDWPECYTPLGGMQCKMSPGGGNQSSCESYEGGVTWWANDSCMIYCEVDNPWHLQHVSWGTCSSEPIAVCTCSFSAPDVAPASVLESSHRW